MVAGARVHSSGAAWLVAQRALPRQQGPTSALPVCLPRPGCPAQGRDAEAASGFLDEIKLLNSLAGRSNIIQLIDSEVGEGEGVEQKRRGSAGEGDGLAGGRSG